jgi:hypothetical protein
MQRDEAGLDRVIRGVAAITAAVAPLAVGPTSGARIALVVVAVVMAGTAATGFCRSTVCSSQHLPGAGGQQGTGIR